MMFLLQSTKLAVCYDQTFEQHVQTIIIRRDARTSIITLNIRQHYKTIIQKSSTVGWEINVPFQH